MSCDLFFQEIERYQIFLVLKGATYTVFVLRCLLHWCFHVLVLYSKSVPVWLSVWFLPLEQVSFVSIQAPAIRYAYRKQLRYDFSIFRLIVTPLQARQVTWGGRTQVVGRSLIGRKALQVSRRSIAGVWQRSGRDCDSEARVYADRLTNGMRGLQARKSVVVQSQVTLITWPIIHFLFPRMSVAPQNRCKC